MSQSQNFDTTYTKIFVGGLAWVTRNEGLRSFFQQFGEIIHVNVVCDSQTQRSKGYGFVTFKDAESATRACANRNPIIDGRQTDCKLASEGENVNHNQPNIIGLRHDDLCYLSPTFVRNQLQLANIHQPSPAYIDPYYWNQHYQQYYPHAQYNPHMQYAPQYNPHPQYAPQQYNPVNNYSQYVPQYDPQYHQYYFAGNTNTMYRPHQSTNVPRENPAASRASTSGSLSSTPRSSLE